jgi:PST family polysaccharide transporter
MPAAGVLAIWLLFTRMRLPLRQASAPPWKDLRTVVVGGWDLFLSTAAISLYASSNIFVLGLLEGPTVVGYYAMADKLIKAALGLTQPLSQALYPRMSYLFSRDVSGALLRLKAVAVPASVAVLVLGLMFLFAGGAIVRMVFGATAEPASNILRILAFVPLMVLLSNMLGVQLLFPLGRQRPVAHFQAATGVVSAIALVPMIWHWGAIGCAVNYLLSETLIVLGFLCIAMKALKGARYATARG